MTNNATVKFVTACWELPLKLLRASKQILKGTSAIVLDMRTQNGEEPVGEITFSRGKVAFLARIPVETARYTLLRQIAVNDDN